MDEVPFSQVARLEYGKALPESGRSGDGFPVVGSSGVVGRHNEHLVPGPAVVVGRKGNAGSIHWVDQDCWPIDTTFWVKPSSPEKLSLRYCSYWLEAKKLGELGQAGARPGLSRDRVHELPFRMLPIEEQNRIGDLLSAVDATCEASRRYLETVELVRSSAADSGLRLEGRGSRTVALKDVVDVNPGQVPKDERTGELRYIDIASIAPNLGGVSTEDVREMDWSEAPSRARRTVSSGDVLVGTVRPYLRSFARATSELDGCVASTGIAVLRPSDEISPDYLWGVVCSGAFVEFLVSRQSGSNYPAVRAGEIGGFRFALPDADGQRVAGRLVDAAQTGVRAAATRVDSLTRFRSSLLYELLDAGIEIPESYDRFLIETDEGSKGGA